MDKMAIAFLNIPLLSITLYILAYIDPGTGSIILQAIAAAVAGAAIAAKFYWHRILRFFGHKKSFDSELSGNEGDREV
jgi:hypothetical protein